MDKDLEILRKFSKEDLKLIILLMQRYKNYVPTKPIFFNNVFDENVINESPHNHVEKIANKLLEIAANKGRGFTYTDVVLPLLRIGKSLAEIWRDNSYKGMLFDVCKKVEVEVQKKNSVEEMERKLLAKHEQILEDKLSQLTQKGKEKFFKGYKAFMQKHYGILITDTSQITVRAFVKHFWMQTILFSLSATTINFIGMPWWWILESLTKWILKPSIYKDLLIPTTLFIAGRRREIEGGES